MTGRWQFWIGRGGTFTDVVARRPDDALVTHALLSENPECYPEAAIAAIRARLRRAAMRRAASTGLTQFTAT